MADFEAAPTAPQTVETGFQSHQEPVAPQTDTSPNGVLAEDLEGGLGTMPAADVLKGLGDESEDQSQQHTAQNLGIKDLSGVGPANGPEGPRDLPPLPSPQTEEGKVEPAIQPTKGVNEHPEIDPSEVVSKSEDELRADRAAQQGSPEIDTSSVAGPPGEAPLPEGVEPGSETTGDTAEAPVPSDTDKKDASLPVDPEIQALQAKYDNDEYMTPEQLKKLRDSKNTPEDRAKELRKKPLSEWTDEDIENFADWTNPEYKENADSDEKIKRQKLEDLGVEVFADLLNSEVDPEQVAEKINQFNAQWAEMQGFQQPAQNSEQARNYVKDLLSPENAKKQKELPKQKAIREKLVELAQLEMQLRNRAEVMKKMKEQEKEIENQVKKAEGEYKNSNSKNPEERQQKFTVWSGKVMQLAQHQANITIQRAIGREVKSKRLDAFVYIHRKLGTGNPVRNLVDGMWAGVYGTYANARTDIDSYFD